MKVMLDGVYVKILQIVETKLAPFTSDEWNKGEEISLVELEGYGYKWVPTSAIEY